MSCLNYTKISDKLGQCSVLKELGVNYIVSDNRVISPCNTCKKEWVDKEPTKDTLTPTMQLVLQANGKIELPTITERAVSFGKALANWAFQGFPNVPQNEYDLRVNTCKENKCGMYDAEKDLCNGCGCKIQSEGIIPGKAKYASEECPANLWTKLGPEYHHQMTPGKCGGCGSR